MSNKIMHRTLDAMGGSAIVEIQSLKFINDTNCLFGVTAFDSANRQTSHDSWQVTIPQLKSLKGEDFGVGGQIKLVKKDRMTEVQVVSPGPAADTFKARFVQGQVHPWNQNLNDGRGGYDMDKWESKEVIESLTFGGDTKYNPNAANTQQPVEQAPQVQHSAAPEPEPQPRPTYDPTPAPEVASNGSAHTSEPVVDYAGYVIQQAFALMSAFRYNEYGQEVAKWLNEPGDELLKKEFFTTVRGICQAAKDRGLSHKPEQQFQVNLTDLLADKAMELLEDANGQDPIEAEWPQN